MLNTTIKPQKTKKQDRILVSINNKGPMIARINSLNSKFRGMELGEIVKLALIKLDDGTKAIEIDETEWLLNNPGYGQDLVNQINEVKQGKFEAITFKFEDFLKKYD